MLKNIVFFQDYDLHTRLEMSASRQGKDVEKYRLELIVNYFAKKYPDKNYEKIFKKPMDLWVACFDEATKYEIPVATFIEMVVKEEIDKVEVLSKIVEFNNKERESVAEGNIVKDSWFKRFGSFLDLNANAK